MTARGTLRACAAHPLLPPLAQGIEDCVRAHRMRTAEGFLRRHATLPRGW